MHLCLCTLRQRAAASVGNYDCHSNLVLAKARLRLPCHQRLLTLLHRSKILMSMDPIPILNSKHELDREHENCCLQSNIVVLHQKKLLAWTLKQKISQFLYLRQQFTENIYARWLTMFKYWIVFIRLDATFHRSYFGTKQIWS